VVGLEILELVEGGLDGAVAEVGLGERLAHRGLVAGAIVAHAFEQLDGVAEPALGEELVGLAEAIVRRGEQGRREEQGGHDHRRAIPIGCEECRGSRGAGNAPRDVGC